MTTERDLSTWEGRIAWLRGQGYANDEIEDAFDLASASVAEVHRAHPPGTVIPLSAASAVSPLGWPARTKSGEILDWSTLRGRRRIQALLTDGRDPTIPVRSAERVAECHKAIKTLRRNGLRVSVSAVARLAGVQRETVAGYVRRGWVSLAD